MKTTTVSFPEIGLFASTRVMLGVGIGLLVGQHMSDSRRKAVGRTLLAIGALSTIPLVIDLVSKSKPSIDREKKALQQS